ncbi:Diaminopimelate decarboxylase [Candidatus Portiera aleyrodidarum]|uniref:Diaminopimelate decarboxylase n=1 Tax=Candidatus Portiera aleyrodidarum TV TaxID=1297582 RepID=A0A8D3X8S9_9GAMM|nr:diaminopimelate decarboxylase [Candidatus Portiera aleyrodidarum]AGI27261.1 diaminopimelate decarboxylase [Candidatus Portiera aleyrodidarum TV]CEI59256.1 Diaminopimelate decarboxylase [Candidatus Portiera aleyrodidarum]
MTFQRYKGILFIENISCLKIAKKFGTPCYVYSKKEIIKYFNYYKYQLSLINHPNIICYALKANSNIAILNILSQLGSGFDIVSIGELEKVLIAGGDPKKIVYSGVAKKKQEIKRALKVGIKCFNVESFQEMDRINEIAIRLKNKANISIRINPNVDAKTHPYISTGLKSNKFGISIDKAEEAYFYANSLTNIKVIGIDFHIGSQILNLNPFLEALDNIILLIKKLYKKKIKLNILDIGGGLGVNYKKINFYKFLIKKYFTTLCERILANIHNIEIILEPGRSILANTGVLLTSVEIIKKTKIKNFAIVDAGMNDFIRPAFYNAWHNIEVVDINKVKYYKKLFYDIVGPICESSDFLGKKRYLNKLSQNDLLVIHSVGAYGFVMSSNYNTRKRPSELLVDKNQLFLIRESDSLKSLCKNEYVNLF